MITGSKQSGQGKASHACQTGLYHSPPIHDCQAFSFGTVKVSECVAVPMIVPVRTRHDVSSEDFQQLIPA
jgi:hypothetical protein